MSCLFKQKTPQSRRSKVELHTKYHRALNSIHSRRKAILCSNQRTAEFQRRKHWVKTVSSRCHSNEFSYFTAVTVVQRTNWMNRYVYKTVTVCLAPAEDAKGHHQPPGTGLVFVAHYSFAWLHLWTHCWSMASKASTQVCWLLFQTKADTKTKCFRHRPKNKTITLHHLNSWSVVIWSWLAYE